MHCAAFGGRQYVVHSIQDETGLLDSVKVRKAARPLFVLGLSTQHRVRTPIDGKDVPYDASSVFVSLLDAFAKCQVRFVSSSSCKSHHFSLTCDVSKWPDCLAFSA